MPTKKFRFTLIPRAEALAHEDIIIGITDFVAKEETIPKCLPNPDKQRVGGGDNAIWDDSTHQIPSTKF